MKEIPRIPLGGMILITPKNDNHLQCRSCVGASGDRPFRNHKILIIHGNWSVFLQTTVVPNVVSSTHISSSISVHYSHQPFDLSSVPHSNHYIFVSITTKC